MKIKVSNTTPLQLDWLVAKCEQAAGKNIREGFGGSLLVVDEHDFGAPSRYSTDWAQAGPILEREKIGVDYYNTGKPLWIAGIAGTFQQATGPTPLVAAMRCYVASRLGDEVEVPDELGKQS